MSRDINKVVLRGMYELQGEAKCLAAFHSFHPDSVSKPALQGSVYEGTAYP